ncbi:ATP-binding protein [Arcobacter sp. FWKO B]|uniref:ATP-binding protein n=1 Tax=Arcobacter sp. FWKO B TaxID=2593672 RepID=UPI0018A5AAC2|nr:ATP-binding protein [Arcobacter sp. FWKO B]QOG12727.1 hypothetical protein FWKOB_08485 [Arcobacter sp. FWKO B]
MDKIYKIRYLLLIPIFIFIATMLFFITNSDKNKRINNLIHQQSQLVHSHYKSIFNSYEMVANTLFIIISDSPNVRDIYKKFYSTSDIELQNIYRNQLYQLFQNRYEKFKNLGLEQLHFHTKTNESFLRLHKPDWYGDDLTDIRQSVRYVNTNKQPITGFELGRVIHGFRYVFPLFDQDNTHLGSVETSISSEMFLDTLQKTFDSIAISFIVDKSLTNEHLFDSYNKIYTTSYETDNYLVLKNSISSQNSELKQHFSNQLNQQINSNIQTKEIFSLVTRINNENIIATFIPVKEINFDSIAGYIVSYHKSNFIDTVESDFFRILSISYIILIVLFLLIYKMILSLYKISMQQIEELNNEKELRQKDNLIYQQSKMASLGEMISNIAHQWRQPLNAISTAASGMKLQNELNILDKDGINTTSDNIINYTQYLSNIINEFRNFTKNDKKKVNTNIQSILAKSLLLIDSNVKLNHIIVINHNTLETPLHIYENELIQAILKILQNAIEAILKDTSTHDKVIVINTELKDNCLNISIQDSANGIDENNIDKVFDPYFTTKHKSQGVGLGLYVTYQIVTHHFNGTIKVTNSTFTYQGREISGAKFDISIPLNQE